MILVGGFFKCVQSINQTGWANSIRDNLLYTIHTFCGCLKMKMNCLCSCELNLALPNLIVVYIGKNINSPKNSNPIKRWYFYRQRLMFYLGPLSEMINRWFPPLFISISCPEAQWISKAHMFIHIFKRLSQNDTPGNQAQPLPPLSAISRSKATVCWWEVSHQNSNTELFG